MVSHTTCVSGVLRIGLVVMVPGTHVQRPDFVFGPSLALIPYRVWHLVCACFEARGRWRSRKMLLAFVSELFMLVC